MSWQDVAKEFGMDAEDKLHAEELIQEMAEEIMTLRNEVSEQARLNGMGSEREAKRMAQLVELRKERDASNYTCIQAHKEKLKWKEYAEKLREALESLEFFIRLNADGKTSYGGFHTVQDEFQSLFHYADDALKIPKPGEEK